jgi:1,2-diacylglycerol 3-alpha-glucosyltransferase
MRIAVFTDSFLPYICGATFAALNQINALARQGHLVRIYCPGSTHDRPHTSETDELHESVTVRTVPFSLPWGGQPNLNVVFPVLWPTMKDLREFQPDAIHVHTEWGTGWAGVFAAWRLKIPAVGTFHTFWDDPRYVHHFPWPNWKIIQRAMGRYSAFFYRRCAATIAPSTTVQTHLRAKNVESVVVSNGMTSPAPVSAAEVRALRQAYGLADHPTFLYLGRVSFEKSLPVCLLAFKELLSTHPQARFVMIGDGPEMPALKGMIRAMDMTDQVVLVGAVPHEELMARGLPRLGDVFITASETENQPVSILESMAFGLPAIGPRARGIPELVEDGQNGHLFEPGDGTRLTALMRQMVDAPAQRAALAQGALATAESHSIDRTGERLRILYEACIRDPATAQAALESQDPDAGSALQRSS